MVLHAGVRVEVVFGIASAVGLPRAANICPPGLSHNLGVSGLGPFSPPRQRKSLWAFVACEAAGESPTLGARPVRPHAWLAQASFLLRLVFVGACRCAVRSVCLDRGAEAIQDSAGVWPALGRHAPPCARSQDRGLVGLQHSVGGRGKYRRKLRCHYLSIGGARCSWQAAPMAMHWHRNVALVLAGAQRAS